MLITHQMFSLVDSSGFSDENADWLKLAGEQDSEDDSEDEMVRM